MKDASKDSTLRPSLEMMWKSSKLYNHCFDEIQREYGLTANERDVLLFLYNNQGCNTAADIVKYRSISKSLVSKSVESLTGRGLLQSRQGTGDRRQTHLHITPEAREIATELAQAQRQFFEMLGEDIAEEEWNAFRAVIKKIKDNADRYSRKE